MRCSLMASEFSSGTPPFFAPSARNLGVISELDGAAKPYTLSSEAVAWKSTGVAVAAFPPGSKREVMIEGATLLLVRIGPLVHAVDGICPHEGGLLADGALEQETIVCPQHGAEFDTVTGKVLADPDGVKPPAGGVTPLVRYATRVDGGIVWVDLD
jgi:3-phenylpropionate/trans-cinnamate dioxygenase ferredoxin component